MDTWSAADLKAFAYALSFLAPLVVLLIGFAVAEMSGEPAGKGLGCSLAVVSWLVGFFVLQFAMGWVQSIWMRATHGRRLTEDEFFFFPDGPNLTAGWIVFGWVRVAAGYAVAWGVMAAFRYFRRRSAKKKIAA